MHVINGRAAPPLIGAEWREFLRWPLYVSLLISLLLFILAYQVPSGAGIFVDAGAAGDSPFLIDFYAHETNPDKQYPYNYRWSQQTSFLIVPGVGRNVPLDLTMSLAGRPAVAPAAVLTVTVNGQPLALLHPTGYPPNPYAVHIPASANNQDDLNVALTSNAFQLKGDSRQLGVVVDWMKIDQAGAGIVLPPVYPVAWLLVSLLLAFLTLRHVGVSRRATFLGTVALAILAGIVLIAWRYQLTTFVVQIFVVMACVYALALLMPLLVQWMMARFRVGIGALDLRWLMLIYLAAFAIKAGGMMHPQFVPVDHIFRVHQVQELVTSPSTFWDKYQRVSTAEGQTIHSETENSMLGQWNLQVPFPYSPFGYFILAPFGLIWPHGFEDRVMIASDTMLAALSGTIIFALYAIARRGFGATGGRAGIIAAAIMSFAPITYLHFSDGAYPYIWAGWISIVYIMAAICLADRAGKPGPFILLTILSALSFLSHTAIAFFAVTFAGLALLINVLLKRIWGKRDVAIHAYSMLPLFLSFTVGAILSLVYYGAYILPLLTVALPALAQKGASQGVGLDQRYLGRPLLSGFWPQLQVHFTTWPALVSVFGLASLITREQESALNPQQEAKDSNAEQVSRYVTLVFTGAWVLTFLLFSLLDLRVNLLQRHMLFGLPLLSLLAGYLLAKVNWEARAPAVRLGVPAMAVLLIAYLFIAGWDMWMNRVLFYILPPGSG